MSTDVTYEGGQNLQAGPISTDQIPLDADTYYPGMLLEYSADGVVTADGGNTGDGTVTAVTANDKAVSGSYNLECIEAVTNGGVFKLEDPSGNIVASDLTIDVGAGAATIFTVAGLTFTITDGATDFAAGDKFTLAIETGGTYKALATDVNLGAIYNGAERTLSSAGVGQAIMSGEINESGLVDSSDSALTLTEDQRAIYRSRGFDIKRV